MDQPRIVGADEDQILFRLKFIKDTDHLYRKALRLGRVMLSYALIRLHMSADWHEGARLSR